MRGPAIYEQELGLQSSNAEIESMARAHPAQKAFLARGTHPRCRRHLNKPISLKLTPKPNRPAQAVPAEPGTPSGSAL